MLIVVFSASTMNKTEEIVWPDALCNIYHRIMARGPWKREHVKFFPLLSSMLFLYESKS